MSTDLIQQQSLQGFSEASFQHLGMKVYAAKTPRKVIGIWDSEVIDGSEYLLTWREAVAAATLNGVSDRVYLYDRTGPTSDLSAVAWSDPGVSLSLSIPSTDRYLQIRIVVVAATPSLYPGYQSQPIGPTVEQLTIKGVTSQTAAYFFTKAFPIGFYPKSVVITAETEVPENSILRFAVSSLDSIDPSDYQFVELNRLAQLDQLSVTGTHVRFMIEMSGNSGESVVVHEFAAMFSGYGQAHLNP
jgi:hypothetical protein